MDKRALIVIVTMNSEDDIQDCLNSIKEKTNYPEEMCDIVVVDNNSEDNTLNILKNFNCDIISNDGNLGFSIANNQALHSYDEYDYYLLLNPDTQVTEGWLGELISTGESSDQIGIVGPKLLYPDLTLQLPGHKIPTLGHYREIGAPESCLTEKLEVDCVSGAAFLVKKEVVEDIGYLDEIFSPINFEELDFCARANEAGFKAVIEPDSVVVHKKEKSKEQLNSNIYNFLSDKNKIKFQLLNGNLTTISHTLYQFSKHLIAAFIGYGNNSLALRLGILKEVGKDLPSIIHKRFNRTNYIPSYYCEGVTNYSNRYIELN